MIAAKAVQETVVRKKRKHNFHKLPKIVNKWATVNYSLSLAAYQTKATWCFEQNRERWQCYTLRESSERKHPKTETSDTENVVHSSNAKAFPCHLS